MIEEKESMTHLVLSVIRNRIFTGLIIVIPSVVTILITIFLYQKLTEWSVAIVEMIPPLAELIKEFWFVQLIRFGSVLVMLFLLFCVGQFAKHALGKNVIYYAEKLLLKVPMLSTVYSTIQQMGDALWSTKSGVFRQVIMFEYPRKGLWVLGFLTNENPQPNWEPRERVNKDLISVFLPTTPNPTSGFLLFIPREDCIFLDMEVTQGMRLIISGGAVTSASYNPGIGNKSWLGKIKVPQGEIKNAELQPANDKPPPMG